MNPDILRVNKDAIDLIKEFNKQGKPIAAICHAPWLLIEAGLADKRTMTGYESIHTDMANAGANVKDASVVIDGNLITSRFPDDLDDFVGAIKDSITKQYKTAA